MSNETMKWYAIKTQNNREKAVLEKFKSEIDFNKLTEKFGRTIIPTEKVFSVKNGKRIFREKVTYPGYIFIETSALGEISNIIKNVPGMTGFVKTKSGEISPLKEYEVKKILNDQDAIQKDDNSSIYIIGESVKIIDGPFQTFKGIVEQVDNDKKKIKVSVSIFSRKTMVDLDIFQIERDEA